jgi:hypothetical protein
MKRITHEEFVLRLKRENPSIDVLGKFNGILNPIKVRCPNNHEWEPIANSILRARKNNKNGNGCATCSGRKKKTHEQFVVELAFISPSIEVVGQFTSVDKKVKVKCNTCSYEWSTSGNSLLRKSGCRICGLASSKLKQRKTPIQFTLDAKSINPDIDILDEYTNSKTHLNCRCKVCNYVWKILPSNIMKGRGCPSCSGHISMSSDEFLKRLKELQPNIQVMGRYVSNKTRALCKCTICNWEWEPPLHRLLKGRGCPSCSGVPDITHEIFITKTLESREDLTVVGKYKTMRQNIACKCNLCNFIWDAPAQHIWKGTSGCPKCGFAKSADSSRKSHDVFMREFRANNLDFETIKLNGEYRSAMTKLDAECLTCGHKWKPIARTLSRGSGCPVCNTAGFDVRKPAIFYLYEILYLGDIYLGYGISNQYAERERTHIKNLTEMSASITSKYLYEFENGQDCLQLETSIKKSLKSEKLNYNLGIEGFITEAAMYSAIHLIFKKIDASNAELAESYEF